MARLTSSRPSGAPGGGSARAAATDRHSHRMRLPGAAGAFALLGEVLWVGILVTVGSLLVVTAPAAIAAGVRHLDRYLHARESSIRTFFADYRAALLPGGVGVGAAAAVVSAVLLLQIFALPGADLPGADVLVVVASILLLAVLVLLVLACASWAPSRTWRHALTASVERAVADPVGALLAAVALGLTVVAAWQLPPLIIPALGCLVFAVTVVRVRKRRR